MSHRSAVFWTEIPGATRTDVERIFGVLDWNDYREDLPPRYFTGYHGVEDYIVYSNDVAIALKITIDVRGGHDDDDVRTDIEDAITRYLEDKQHDRTGPTDPDRTTHG